MNQQLEIFIGFAVLLAAPFALGYFVRLVQAMRRDGGRAPAGWVGAPDLVFALTLGGALAGLAITGLLAEGSEAKPTLQADQVIPGMLFLLVLAGGVVLFLVVRRLPVGTLFGLRELPVGEAIGRGAMMLIAFLPMVFFLMAVTTYLLKEKAQQQELVILFGNAARSGDYSILLTIAAAAVVIAPLCEEVLFRGYFYPVAKRYLGPGTGAVISALLFAATHVNLASLPGLMVLALCFTVAYEKTGSLLVPVGMHACFNGMNLLFLYMSATAQGVQAV